MDISYNMSEFEHVSMLELGRMYEDALSEIIQFCLDKDKSIMTISDLDSEDINNEMMMEINDFLSDLF